MFLCLFLCGFSPSVQLCKDLSEKPNHGCEVRGEIKCYEKSYLHITPSIPRPAFWTYLHITLYILTYTTTWALVLSKGRLNHDICLVCCVWWTIIDHIIVILTVTCVLPCSLKCMSVQFKLWLCRLGTAGVRAYACVCVCGLFCRLH